MRSYLYPLNKWDKRYLELAQMVASWSKDPSTKVGCCIMDAMGNPVSHGFNGFPRGMEDTPERLANREFKYPHTLHAEDNAMSFANQKYLDGCTIYITHPPCTTCLCRMKQRHLMRVICLDGGEEFASRWNPQDSIDLAIELKIELIIIKL